MKKLKHAISLALVPIALESVPLHGRILTPQFTPATPMPLLPTAPIIPAVSVPWPLSSMGSQVIGLATAFTPCVPCGHVIPWNVNGLGDDQMLAAKSGWL